MYYGLDDVEKWSGYRFLGFFYFCVADYISILEILSMAKDLKLRAEGCTLWFKDIKNERMGMPEIKNDLDVVAMALAMDHIRITNLCVKVTKVYVSSSDDVLRNTMVCRMRGCYFRRRCRT